MTPVILIHYDEIGLKGKNRAFFEQKLIDNLRHLTGLTQIEKEYGRLIIYLKETHEFNKLKRQINKVFGISNYSLAYKTENNLNKIEKYLLQLIKEKEFKTFRITAKRSNKNFKFSSYEINRKIGQLVKDKTLAQVKLNNADLNINLEIGEKSSFIYFEKLNGPGGLPVTTAGHLTALLSGGIDSPVAAWQMIKRGAKLNFIHFHSYPQTSMASIKKVKQIVNLLADCQHQANLYLVPFLELQKEAFKKINHQYLIIIYRRFMLKIASEIAAKEASLGLVTGDSLGQVASQTLENMAAIGEAVSLPIYRPLIGFDKFEIVNLAKKIGSYDISIQPHQDCCSLFVPKHPATKANLALIAKEEAKLPSNRLIKNMLEKTEVINIKQDKRSKNIK